MEGAFEDGTVLWFWYNTYIVVPAAIVVYLTVRTLLGFSWRARGPLGVKALSILGAAIVVLAALDRFTIETLSMDADFFGYSSLVGAGFSTLVGLVAVIKARRGKKDESEETEEAAEEAAAVDGGIPGATQVFTRVRGASAWMVTRSREESGSIIQIEGENVTVGSDEANEIQLSDISVDPNHALIRVNQGRYSLFDMGSTGGTSVNGSPLDGVMLRDGSRISLGDTELFFTQVAGAPPDPGEESVPQTSKGVLLVRSGPTRGQSFQVGDGDLIIGRQPGEGGARIDDPAVSQRHALLRPTLAGSQLFDLGSSNATSVDDVELTGHQLENGDVVRFGGSEFQFVLEEAV